MSIFQYKLKITPEYDVNLNNIFGMFEYSENHIGGETIKYAPTTHQGASSYWIPTQYTLAELTRDYAKQGRTNPSKEAYESLQRELLHYLEGYTLFLQGQIWLNDILLSEDCITTDYSYHYFDSEEDCANECASEYFCIKSLIKEAKARANDLSLELAKIA